MVDPEQEHRWLRHVGLTIHKTHCSPCEFNHSTVDVEKLQQAIRECWTDPDDPASEYWVALRTVTTAALQLIDLTEHETRSWKACSNEICQQITERYKQGEKLSQGGFPNER